MVEEIIEKRLTRSGAAEVAVGAAVVAAGAALVAVALSVSIVLRSSPPSPSAPMFDFDSVVQIPPNAPETESGNENGMPSRAQLMLARIDAWVLTHDLFTDLKGGKITRAEAITNLCRMVRMAQKDDFELFYLKQPEYIQTGETEPLIYLLQTAISNLVAGVTDGVSVRF